MGLPYENATSGGAALEEIRKMLTAFGCTRFGTMTDTTTGELIVQFTYRSRDVSARASYRGYAALWLKKHPLGPRARISRKDLEARALKQGEISVCSILRDWIKSQVMAVETGALSFEGAFLGALLLSNGNSVLEEVQHKGLLQLTGPVED